VNEKNQKRFWYHNAQQRERAGADIYVFFRWNCCFRKVWRLLTAKLLKAYSWV